MDNTSQPGRIEPPQSTGKISGAVSSKGAKYVAALGPEGLVASKAIRVAQRLSSKTASESDGPRITTFGQAMFIGFAIMVDLTEAILDLFVVGIIINRIIDIVVAGIFFLYALAKGLTIAGDWKIYGSIAGTIAGEFMPGLDIAPFFAIDAWYITHTIKAKDKARQSAAEEQAAAIATEQGRQEWIANYQAQQAEQIQEENQLESEPETIEQEASEQKTDWQKNDGVGRIAPLQFKTPTEVKQPNTEQQRKAA